MKSMEQEKVENFRTQSSSVKLLSSEPERSGGQDSQEHSLEQAASLNTIHLQSAYLSRAGSNPTLSHQLMRRLQRQNGNRYVQRVLGMANMAGDNEETGPDVEQAIQSARGGGQALDGGLRRQVEPLFGADFSSVHVHTSAEADGLNRAVSARAFTVGQDIFFRDSEYNPGSSKGRELLAHELTHVVQQSSGKFRAKLTVSSPGDAYEQEADQVAVQISHKLNRSDGLTLDQDVKTSSTGAQLQPKRNGKEDTDSMTGAILGGALGALAGGLGFLGTVAGILGAVAMVKKTVTLTHTKVFGSANSIDTAITFANSKVFNQANVELVKGKEVTLDEADSKKIVGDDLILDEFVDPTKPTAEEQALMKVNQAAGAISAYYVKDFSSGRTTGESFIPSNGVGVGVAVGNQGIDQTFAHELGHVLLDDGGHNVPDSTYLMDPTVGAAKTKLTPEQIAKIRSSTFAK